MFPVQVRDGAECTMLDNSGVDLGNLADHDAGSKPNFKRALPLLKLKFAKRVKTVAQ